MTTNTRNIAFFDIDGTLTSEVDHSIPQLTIQGIRQAREAGHLMFINTGRCYHNVPDRFRNIGFDGYVCGCGTNIHCDNKEILAVAQTHETAMEILDIARATDVDLLFEAKTHLCFDMTRPLKDLHAQHNTCAVGEHHTGIVQKGTEAVVVHGFIQDLGIGRDHILCPLPGQDLFRFFKKLI